MSNDRNVEYVLEVISAFAKQYGGIVVAKKGGVRLDLGQALCYHAYGPNWNDIVGEDDDADIAAMVTAANEWQRSGVPSWVKEIK